jgi:hypothetical protein
MRMFQYTASIDRTGEPMALGSVYRVNTHEQEQPMDPMTRMLYDIIARDEDALLHSLTDDELDEHLSDLVDGVATVEADEKPDPLFAVETAARSQMAHAHLIVQGRDVEALDFFSRINAIRPILPPDVTYTAYVASIRQGNAH